MSDDRRSHRQAAQRNLRRLARRSGAHHAQARRTASLPINEKLSSIGKPTPRIDGRLKVTGAARYTADVRLPGMLYGRIVRSVHPHARVRAIDTRDAERVPGVRAVEIVEHLIGSAKLRDPSQEPPAPYPIVRYVGQPIAAVAATTQAIADEAARKVRVDYEPLPFVVDLEEARRPDAPKVFPGAADQGATAGGGGGPGGVAQTGNVRGPNRSGTMGPPRGDVEKGLAEADVTLDATYSTQVQTHSPMETHGVVVDWSAEGLTVYASTQGTTSVRDEMSGGPRHPRQPGARRHRVHGGRLRRQVRRGQLRHPRRAVVEEGGRARAPHARSPRRARGRR